MFPDSQIPRSCGHTKTTAIIKGALAPHFLEKMISNMANLYSILMDESNDKSCILRKLDPDIRTRFLDMPVVSWKLCLLCIYHEVCSTTVAKLTSAASAKEQYTCVLHTILPSILPHEIPELHMAIFSSVEAWDKSFCFHHYLFALNFFTECTDEFPS